MKLTRNFNSEEFRCKDAKGTPVPGQYMSNLLELAINLQVLRDYIKEPVLLTGSGYRTPAWNKKVGGAVESQHMTASAGDINAKNYTPRELANVIELLITKGLMKQGGLGVYPGFVHYDIRGIKARW
jgi:uncharacterized protein YcbK (DUF882 family)